MKLFITGATSFVGCHLALGFQAAGYEVIAALSGENPMEGIRGLRMSRMAGRGIRFRPLDLRQPENVAEVVSEEKPDLWIQHAGYTRGYGSDAYDLATGFAINVLPLTPIFRAMAEQGGGVIVTGTVSEYSNGEAPHREDEACRPPTAYGLAKLA